MAILDVCVGESLTTKIDKVYEENERSCKCTCQRAEVSLFGYSAKIKFFNSLFGKEEIIWIGLSIAEMSKGLDRVVEPYGFPEYSRLSSYLTDWEMEPSVVRRKGTNTDAILRNKTDIVFPVTLSCWREVKSIVFFTKEVNGELLLLDSMQKSYGSTPHFRAGQLRITIF